MLSDGTMISTLSYFSDKISPKINWLFFDLGSTLIDESECYKSRIDEIVESNNLSHEEFAFCVAESAKKNAFAIKSAASKYGVKVPEWRCELEKLYPFTKRILEKLSEKYRLGIIANQEAGTQGRLEKWGIRQFFDVVVTSSEVKASKPDFRIFELALQQAVCKPNESVMIGDRLDNDIIPAKKLGMKTVWVKQGFTKYQPDSEMPDYTVDSIDELLNIL